MEVGKERKEGVFFLKGSRIRMAVVHSYTILRDEEGDLRE
jgi:hypothetical protein